MVIFAIGNAKRIAAKSKFTKPPARVHPHSDDLFLFAMANMMSIIPEIKKFAMKKTVNIPMVTMGSNELSTPTAIAKRPTITDIHQYLIFCFASTILAVIIIMILVKE